MLARYRASPAEAAEALFLEYVSMCLNPSMTLYATRSLRSVLERDGNREAQRLLEERLDGSTWAVYRVRRIVWAKGRADRRTDRTFEGDRRAAEADVRRRGGGADAGVIRVRERGDRFPTAEEMFVAAPAVAAEKSRPSFEANWHRLVGPDLWDGAGGR